MDETMGDLWAELHDLFETDDGSLPDIFVENLSGEQVCSVYRWVRSQYGIYTGRGDPTFWNFVEERDVPIHTIEDPAELVIQGRAAPFRHGLHKVMISGVELPHLTVAVFPDAVHFDYQMGSEWGPTQVAALFDFLWAIQQTAPTANISHAYEGDSVRSASFARAWHDFRSAENTA